MVKIREEAKLSFFLNRMIEYVESLMESTNKLLKLLREVSRRAWYKNKYKNKYTKISWPSIF